jgi:hypothetical protein
MTEAPCRFGSFDLDQDEFRPMVTAVNFSLYDQLM